MKTRDELLNDAIEYIDNAEHNEVNVQANAAMVSAQALLAIACVMLAKERRESEMIPFVIAVTPTIGEMRRVNEKRQAAKEVDK